MLQVLKLPLAIIAGTIVPFFAETGMLWETRVKQTFRGKLRRAYRYDGVRHGFPFLHIFVEVGFAVFKAIQLLTDCLTVSSSDYIAPGVFWRTVSLACQVIEMRVSLPIFTNP